MMVQKLFLRNQALLGMPSVICRALCLLLIVLLGLGPPTHHPHHGNAAAGQGGASFLLLSTATAVAAADAKEIPMIITTNDAMDEEDALVLSDGSSSVVKNVVGGVKAPITLTTMVKGGPVGAGGDPVLLDLHGGGTHGDDVGSGRSKVEEVSTDREHHERGNCSLFLICIPVY